MGRFYWVPFKSLLRVLIKWSNVSIWLQNNRGGHHSFLIDQGFQKIAGVPSDGD